MHFIFAIFIHSRLAAARQIEYNKMDLNFFVCSESNKHLISFAWARIAHSFLVRRLLHSFRVNWNLGHNIRPECWITLHDRSAESRKQIEMKLENSNGKLKTQNRLRTAFDIESNVRVTNLAHLRRVNQNCKLFHLTEWLYAMHDRNFSAQRLSNPNQMNGQRQREGERRKHALSAPHSKQQIPTWMWIDETS